MLRLAYVKRGWIAYCPWFLSLCLLSGNFFAYFLTCFLLVRINDDSVLTVVTSASVYLGLLTAMSISMTTQIQNIAFRMPFSMYLDKEGKLEGIMNWPKIVYVFNILLLLFFVFIVYICNTINNYFNSYVVLNVIVLTIYISRKNYLLFELVNDVYFEYYDFQRIFFENYGVIIDNWSGIDRNGNKEKNENTNYTQNSD